jgi:hypothetical protein
VGKALGQRNAKLCSNVIPLFSQILCKKKKALVKKDEGEKELHSNLRKEKPPESL